MMNERVYLETKRLHTLHTTPRDIYINIAYIIMQALGVRCRSFGSELALNYSRLSPRQEFESRVGR